MKFVVFTPTGSHSAIGRMNALVTHAIAEQGHDVVIVASEWPHAPSGERHDFGAPVIPWTARSDVETNARRADAVVYHLGDHMPNHRGVIEWFTACPGLLCLHDRSLDNFLDALVHFDPGFAVPLIANTLGPTFINGRDPGHAPSAVDFRRSDLLLRWLAGYATGVITHSAWAAEPVRSVFAGSVTVVPIAYQKTTTPHDRASSSDSFDRLRLLTLGHVNPNKRVAQVIDAIASSPALRKAVTYTVVGSISNEIQAALTSQARAQGVDLDIRGSVSIDELGQALADTDAVAALRWPALEAASASAVEAMLNAKPTLVTDTGFYAELPDDCVVKIDPDREVDTIRAALEGFLRDPEARAALGQHAAQYASATFTAEGYADALITMATSAARTRPSLDAARSVGRMLADWDAAAGIRSDPTLRAAIEFIEVQSAP